MSLQCLIDNNTKTVLIVKLKRKHTIIADKRVTIEKIGIEHHLDVPLASIDFNNNQNLETFREGFEAM